MDLNKLAQKIISQNEYLTLATMNDEGKPWTCILAYCFDKDYSFYFVSLPTSQHARHFTKNNGVAFSIFDSHQEFGTGVGLQIEAEAMEVHSTMGNEVEKLYFSRVYPYGTINNGFVKGLRVLLKNGTYKFYKLTPRDIWINDPGADTDKRVKVFLKG